MHQEYLNSLEAYYNASRSNSLRFNNIHKQLGSMRALLPTKSHKGKTMSDSQVDGSIAMVPILF
jgi:hypothetical protein